MLSKGCVCDFHAQLPEEVGAADQHALTADGAAHAAGIILQFPDVHLAAAAAGEQLMEEAKQHTEVVVVETYMALGMVIGLAAGAAVGSLLLGKMSFGMGIGMLIGLIAGSCIHKKPKQQAAETIEQSAERENNKENKE